MTTLAITERGQVTFRKDVLRHLGLRPGERVRVHLLPGGRCVLEAARPGGSIAGFAGLLAGRSDRVATIEDMNAAAAEGWSGDRR